MISFLTFFIFINLIQLSFFLKLNDFCLDKINVSIIMYTLTHSHIYTYTHSRKKIIKV